jgi:hypothetical protein
MIRHFCDACEIEISSPNAGVLAVKIHLLERKDVSRMYADRDGNPISSRFENLDLCNACYNKIMGAAVAKLHEIQAERPSEREA